MPLLQFYVTLLDSEAVDALTLKADVLTVNGSLKSLKDISQQVGATVEGMAYDMVLAALPPTEGA